MGRRYRFALLIVAAAAFLASAVPAGFTLYLRYKLVKGLQEANTDIKKMKRLERESEYEVKRVSAGRGTPNMTTIKDAMEKSPEIVDYTTKDIVIGIDGPETYIVEDMPQDLDRDTLHNRDRKDLPIEGAQLVAVDVVREMPQFPGGIPALMAWLDDNILYPAADIRAKVEGDVVVTFYVDAAGKVVEPKITQSLKPELDNAVLRAIRNMPRWKPGKEGGRVTAVCITLPVHFQIR